MSASSTPKKNYKDFVLTRVLKAPRELVFKVFTQPEHMKEWWGPRGFAVIAANMDFRPGGGYHYGLRSPAGHEMWGKISYREIAPPERIVLVNSFSDPDGNITRHPGSPTWPLKLLTTFTFEKHAEGTLFTLVWSLLPDTPTDECETFDAAHDGMSQGWAGSMAQLDAYLAKLVSGTA